MIHFDLPKEQSSIIKVIGIGGGGSNAVNFMYGQNIEGVDFIICNTDSQALTDSPIPNKIQLGPLLTQGLGAGANPVIGKQATEESFEEIKKILEVNTKMAFITAGMGGGTGTGGAPIIARICRELGILTVGIVTTPFSYEGRRRMKQADEGIQALKEYVDTLLVISNDKLRLQFGNLPFKAAFAKADNILATAAKCITDVINIHGIVNVDFADVCTAMRDGGVAILGSAAAEGESRSQKAIDAALSSPLLNDNNIKGAKWILLNITSAEGEHEHTIDEMDVIQAYVQSQAGEECDVILGMGHDNTLDKKLGVTIIATGFKQKPIELQKNSEGDVREDPKILMVLGKKDEEQKMYNQAAISFEEEKPEDKMAPKLVQPEPQSVEPQAVEPQPTGSHPDNPPKPEKPEKAVKQVFELKMDFGPDKQTPSPDAAAKAPEIPGTKPEAPGKPAEHNAGPAKPASYSDGYLSRPARIYADSGTEQDTPSPADKPASKPKQELTLFFKEEASASPQASGPKPPSEHITPRVSVNLEETEEQKKVAAERISRLRNMSFNVKNINNPHELETVPAYIRRDIALDQGAGSQTEPYSGYTIKKEEGKQAEISTINTFLDGKKPD